MTERRSLGDTQITVSGVEPRLVQGFILKIIKLSKMDILLSQLEVGKSYEPVKFPSVKVLVTNKDQIGIFLTRLLFLPEKKLYYTFKDFNGKFGEEGCPFKEILS